MNLELFNLDSDFSNEKSGLQTDIFYNAMICEIFTPKPELTKEQSIVVCYSLKYGDFFSNFAEYIPLLSKRGHFKPLIEAIVNARLTPKSFTNFDPLKLKGKILSIKLDKNESGFLRIFKYVPIILPVEERMGLSKNYIRPGWVDLKFGNENLPETEKEINELLDAETQKSEDLEINETPDIQKSELQTQTPDPAPKPEPHPEISVILPPKSKVAAPIDISDILGGL